MTEQQPQAAQPLAGIEEHVPESMHPVLEFMVKYIKQIAIGVAVILLIVAAFSVTSYMKSRSLDQKITELGRLAAEPASADKAQKLAEFAAGAPSAIETAAIMAWAEAAMEAKDWASAETAWTKLAKIDDAAMNIVAEMGLAKCLMLSGKPQDAYAKLATLKNQASEAFAQPLNLMMAEAAEAAGNTEGAVAAYKTLMLNAQPADQAFFQARIEALQAGN